MKFSVTRVATKDIVTDAFQGIRNLFGLRLRGYEKMLNKHIAEAIQFAESQYTIEWWKLIVNPLSKGSAMIIVYGEGEKK